MKTVMMMPGDGWNKEMPVLKGHKKSSNIPRKGSQSEKNMRVPTSCSLSLKNWDVKRGLEK